MARCISIPKSFSRETLVNGFPGLKYVDGWNDEMKALKLSTLLEGEPLGIWLEATEEEQGVYGTMKEKIMTKMAPMAFSPLQVFHNRKMLLREAIPLYLFELKRLLGQAMAGLAKSSPVFGWITGVCESTVTRYR